MKECRQKQKMLIQQKGALSFHGNGRIYWREKEYTFTSLCFFSTALIIIKIQDENGQHFLFLCRDMCYDKAFRHLSRVCLLAAKKASN